MYDDVVVTNMTHDLISVFAAAVCPLTTSLESIFIITWKKVIHEREKQQQHDHQGASRHSTCKFLRELATMEPDCLDFTAKYITGSDRAQISAQKIESEHIDNGNASALSC